MPVRDDPARGIADRLPVKLSVQARLTRRWRIEVRRVQAQRLGKRLAYRGVARRSVQLCERLHHVQMRVGALASRHLDRRAGRGIEDGPPIDREMLEPAAVRAVVRMLLDRAVERHGAIQRGRVAAGSPVILDQRVHHERLAVEDLAVVAETAVERGGPVVAAMGGIEERAHEEPVAVLGGSEVVMAGVA